MTDRDRGIPKLLAAALTKAEIASDCYVREHAVRTHAARTPAKLQLHSRSQAAVLAYETELVRAGKHKT